MMEHVRAGDEMSLGVRHVLEKKKWSWAGRTVDCGEQFEFVLLR